MLRTTATPEVPAVIPSVLPSSTRPGSLFEKVQESGADWADERRKQFPSCNPFSFPLIRPVGAILITLKDGAIGSKLLAFAFALTSILAPRVAGDDSIAIRKTELHKHTFAVAELKLTITRFRAGSFLSRGFIEVKVENESTGSAIYNPQRLSFVSENNRQVNVRGGSQRGALGHDESWLDVPQPREIAPGAYIKEVYVFDGKLRLPARLFYEGKELALITN